MSEDSLSHIRKNITDIRSLFGLINQVLYTFSMTKSMQPFQKLLKQNTTFQWDDTLQELFEKSKVHILQEIEKGVRIFDKTKPQTGFWLFQNTVLLFDWMENHR